MAASVSIVIITWNSQSEIEPCLSSAAHEDPAEIVVVDNGSTDGTIDLVRRVAPHAKTIELGKNRGFSSGCNVGVRASSAPYVLFLNSDAVVEPGYLTTLVAALEARPDAASAVGKLVYQDNGTRYIDSTGISLRLYAMSPLDRGRGEVDRGQYDRPEEVFGPSAAAALYRRAALDAVGPEFFDEDLFAYYEDVDLAWRLRNLGWRHLYVPTAIAHHARRGPDQKPAAIAARAFANRALVWLKNDSWPHLVLWGPVLVARELVRLGRVALRRSDILPGIAANLARAPHMLRKRSRRKAQGN
jgi:GT2 family glycosyltransferase